VAYIRKVNGKWKAEVERLGKRTSKTFLTKSEAGQWAAAQETAILADKGALYPRKTLADAVDKYSKEISPGKEGSRNEILRLAALCRDFPALAEKQLIDVTTPDMAEWRDARLKLVTPGSVQRDINLIRNVFAIARDEWHWCGHSPFKGLRMPGENPARTRRVLPAEVKRICRRLHYKTGVVEQKSQEVAIAFLIGLRTGMRASEIISLGDDNVDLTKRVARVKHKTQYLTGRPREVPLTRQGVRLLGYLAGRGRYFRVTADSASTLFRKAVRFLLIDDLHFHDSRAEALTRLARKVDVMTLARVSGHADLRILLEVYYRESAADIAGRL
jgi:integrase